MIIKILDWFIDILKFFLKFIGSILVLQIIYMPFLMIFLFINGDNVSFTEVYGNILIFIATIYFSVISLFYYIFQEKIDKSKHKKTLLISLIISAIIISITDNRIQILEVIVINFILLMSDYIQHKSCYR